MRDRSRRRPTGSAGAVGSIGHTGRRAYRDRARTRLHRHAVRCGLLSRRINRRSGPATASTGRRDHGRKRCPRSPPLDRGRRRAHRRNLRGPTHPGAASRLTPPRDARREPPPTPGASGCFFCIAPPVTQRATPCLCGRPEAYEAAAGCGACAADFSQCRTQAGTERRFRPRRTPVDGDAGRVVALVHRAATGAQGFRGILRHRRPEHVPAGVQAGGNSRTVQRTPV